MLALLLALQLTGPTAPAAKSFSVNVEGTGRPMILVPGFVSSGEVRAAGARATGGAR